MTENKANTKQLIINAAAKLFKKYGFEKTSLDDIARALGKSRTFVYIYFKNKEQLFIAQVKNETAPFYAALGDIKLANTTAIEKVKAFNKIKFDFIYKNQKDYIQMNHEIVLNPFLRETLSKITADKEIAIMSDILMLGIKSGEFRKLTTNEARLMSLIFYTAMHAVIGNVYMKKNFKNFIPSWKIVENMFISLLEKY